MTRRISYGSLGKLMKVSEELDVDVGDLTWSGGLDSGRLSQGVRDISVASVV